MDNKIQTNLPSDTSLHPLVKGERNRVSPLRRDFFLSIDYPCKNLRSFQPPSEYNRRYFTACNQFVYQKEEKCSEISDHEICGQDAVFYGILLGWA